MTGSAPDRAPSRPYWVLALLVALFVWPSTAANVAILGAGAAVFALQAVYAARRARRPVAEPASGNGVALGVDQNGGRVTLTDEQLSAHGLILGAAGAGKSTTLLTILCDKIRRGHSVVAIDVKGSPAFAEQLEDAAAAAGRPFKLWTLDGPGHWNPLEHGNATELKDKLIATERFTEPHYKRAAERYLQTVMQVLAHVHPDRPPELPEVVELMDPRRMARMLRRVPDPVSGRVQDYLTTLTADQLSAVRGLGTRLAIVSESHVGRFLTDSGESGARSIDVRRALTGPEVVLFSLNSSTYGGLSAQIGTLVVQDLVAAAGHRLTHGVSGRAIIGIDEFSALDSDNVVSLLVRSREARLPVLLATQEFADLERAGRGVRDQVTGNTAVKIAHRQDVPASARMVAEMVGTERVWEQSFHTDRNVLLGRFDTGRGNRRQVDRFIIDPNEIKSLPTGKAVVITKTPQAQARITRVRPPPRQPDDSRAARSSEAGRRAGAKREGPELG